MGFGRNRKVEILSERSKIPADCTTATRICIRFQEPTTGEQTLRLLKLGSFSPGEVVREATFTVRDNELNIVVYAPHRPGTGFLMGEGFRHKLDFVAASFTQGLFYEWIPTLVTAMVFALILRYWVVASFYIPSGSMENTLLKRDLLIADKLTYKILHHDPQRGDIMIFQYPRNRSLDYIKRVIGLPGEKLEVKGGVVYINDQPLKEDYIREKPVRSFGPVQIGEDEYFMMGDNRNHSQDSRVWGTVDRNLFEGRALFIFFPFNRIRLIEPGLQVMDHAFAADGDA